ncbi:hypothetical protein ACWCRD_04370 [Streptomyces sp. NPDC002092]
MSARQAQLLTSHMDELVVMPGVPWRSTEQLPRTKDEVMEEAGGADLDMCGGSGRGDDDVRSGGGGDRATMHDHARTVTAHAVAFEFNLAGVSVG